MADQSKRSGDPKPYPTTDVPLTAEQVRQGRCYGTSNTVVIASNIEEYEKAGLVRRVDPEERYPRVEWPDEGKPAVKYLGATFVVTEKQAQAFKAMIDAKGKPVGLGPVVDDKAKRVVDSLPRPLFAIVEKVSGNLGYRLICWD